MARPLVLVVGTLVACAGRTKPAAAVDRPAPVDADCLVPRPLTGAVDAPPPEGADLIGPGRWLYVEPWTPDATDDPFRDEVAEAWLGIQDAAGAHRFWPLADLAAGEYDIGDASIVDEADVTGDGIAEYLVEVSSRTSTRPEYLRGSEELLRRTRFVWDPATAQTLAAIEVGWGAFAIAAPACDDWCIDGTPTTEAEEAAFDCDECEDESDEGRQEARLDGTTLVIGAPIRMSGEHSLDGLCPEGRYEWAQTGWVRR